ncbi:MAG: glycosyltransferase [Nevskia sp.]|nr:glycosyltransferase [Nevskia sp.]
MPEHGTDTADPAALRVLLVTTSFPESADDPSGVFVERLASHLARRAAVTVLAPAGRSARRDPAGALRVLRVRYAPAAWRGLTGSPGGIPVALDRNPWLWPVVPLLLAALFARCLALARHADVVHANWSIVGVIAGCAARLAGRPLVTTLRGEDVNRAARSPLYRGILGLCLRLSGRVAVVSQAMLGNVAAQFPQWRSRCVFVANGVARPASAAPAAHRAPGDAAGLSLVAVGSLIPRKDVATIIRALARLDGLPGVRLEVIGDGAERAALERLAASLGVGARVRFCGQVPPPEVAGSLARAQAFVLSSRSEGRSNALLEALAAGLPVLATDIEGVAEIVEDGVNGLLFGAGDDAALAAQIRRLADDPALRERLAQAAAATVGERLRSWEQCAAQYVELYRAVRAERSA